MQAHVVIQVPLCVNIIGRCDIDKTAVRLEIENRFFRPVFGEIGAQVVLPLERDVLGHSDDEQRHSACIYRSGAARAMQARPSWPWPEPLWGWSTAHHGEEHCNVQLDLFFLSD